jgi:hypothetical protein
MTRQTLCGSILGDTKVAAPSGKPLHGLLLRSFFPRVLENEELLPPSASDRVTCSP